MAKATKGTAKKKLSLKKQPVGPTASPKTAADRARQRKVERVRARVWTPLAIEPESPKEKAPKPKPKRKPRTKPGLKKKPKS